MKFSKKLQKLFAMLLVAVMVISVLPMGSLSVFATVGEFAGGDGTEGNPYLIANKTQLNNVRNYLDASFKLLADIEFEDSDFQYGGDFYNNGAGFEPIGSVDLPFSGTFDGDGHVIKNLYINIESDTDVYAGLFAYNRGKIKNLGIVDGSVSARSSSQYAYAGGIAGYNYKGIVTNCYNTGDVVASSSKASAYAGGIVGRDDNHYYKTIRNCYNTGNVSATSSSDWAYAGGIVGDNSGATINCYNTGDVSADASSSDYAIAYAGGIAGSNNDGTIESCYNTGGVSVSSSYYAFAGGIAGSNTVNATIGNCYNTGDVVASSSKASAYAGGIAGSNARIIANCYNTGNVSASSSSSSSYYNAYAGGIVGSNTGTTINCYNIGDVSASSSSSSSSSSSYYNAYAGGIAGRNNDGTTENCYYARNNAKGVGYGTDTATKCTFYNLKKQETFKGFDFETDWSMENEVGYPYPVLINVPMVEFEADYDDLMAEFAGGDGTVENPYLIARKEQLNNVHYYLNAYFKLTADIEFTDADFEEGGAFYNDGSGFVPIGSVDSPFGGTFDGDGHVIKNLYVNIETNTDTYAGLFGYSEGTIKNLGMVDGNITAITTADDGSAYAGGIAGDNDGTITNCYNKGTVSASADSDYGAAYAGGIAGRNNDGTITTCYNIGEVSADVSSDEGVAYIGGIAGDSVEGTITNCYYADNIAIGVGNGTDTTTKCTFDELKNQDTFVGFDFETVWTINSDSDYPYPILQSIPKFEISGITSDIYAIEDGYVFGVGSATTVIDFLNNLNEGSFCKVYNGEDELGNDDLVGTGTVVKLLDGETVVVAYTLVITGDINGDGKIDSTDYLLIKRAAFGTFTLTEAMKLAGDIDLDNLIDSVDYLLIKRICFGTYKI